MNILLIDDHALFREGLKFLLRGLDAALVVDEAGDCAKALEQAAARSYELVLLDLKMPGVAGLDARATQAAPSAPPARAASLQRKSSRVPVRSPTPTPARAAAPAAARSSECLRGVV
jgi:DNA-binding NarL/FixJ family response regulator